MQTFGNKFKLVAVLATVTVSCGVRARDNASPAASLTKYPGITQAYAAIENGYTRKQPKLILSAWSPRYQANGKPFAQAVAELKARFPGSVNKGGFHSPAAFYMPRTVSAAPDGKQVTVSGVCYSISPNNPNNTDEWSNADFAGSFTHVWTQEAGKWRLLSEQRGDYDGKLYDQAMDTVSDAIEKQHKYAGLLLDTKSDIIVPDQASDASNPSAPRKSAPVFIVGRQVPSGPIYQAAYRGNLNKVQTLVKSGISVNTADKAGKSLLHYAAAGGHLAVVKWLTAKGANLNAKSAKGETPLGLARAASLGTDEDAPGVNFAAVIQFLTERGAQESQSDKTE